MLSYSTRNAPVTKLVTDTSEVVTGPVTGDCATCDYLRQLVADKEAQLLRLAGERDYYAAQVVAGPVTQASVMRFAEACLHGDTEHKAWLLEAARAWDAGEAIPKARGGSDKDTLIAELRARIAEFELPKLTPAEKQKAYRERKKAK